MAPRNKALERGVLQATAGLVIACTVSCLWLLRSEWGVARAVAAPQASLQTQYVGKSASLAASTRAMAADAGPDTVGSIDRSAHVRTSARLPNPESGETESPATIVARRWGAIEADLANATTSRPIAATANVPPALTASTPVALTAGMPLATTASVPLPATASKSVAAAVSAPLTKLASLEGPAPRIVTLSGATPAQAAPRIAPVADPKTALINFETAPFPFSGKVLGSNRPFLDAGEAGHRGHSNFRGRVFWESETFNDSHVLLHIPPGFDANKPAVMIVFFHGHGATLARDVRDRQQVPAQISAAGVNAVLVAPQFAFDAADSSAGKFWEPGGFKRFLDEAAKQLARLQGDPRTEQAFASMPIVIVAYSGGYGPTLSVLERGDVNPSRIRGLVLLDALYSGIGKFASWIASNRSGFFVSSYTPHTRGHNADLEEILGEKSVAYDSVLRRNHLSGSVTFLPAGDISHRDFVNRAWVSSPLKDILVRLDDVVPHIESATSFAAARPPAAAVSASVR